MPAKYYYFLISKETKGPIVVGGGFITYTRQSIAKEAQRSYGGSKHVAIKPVKIEDFLKLLK